jgi:hypothetical protein
MSDKLETLDRRQALLGLSAIAAGAPLLAARNVHAFVPTTPSGNQLPLGLVPTLPVAETPEQFLARVRLGADAPSGPVNLFSPIGIGDEVGLGWTLAEVRAPERGAMLVGLVKGADSARVHVCLNEGSPVGPARTDDLDFVIMNHGKGRSATNEEVGRVVLTLASLAAGTGIVPEGLLTHQQRLDAWLLSPEPGTLL